MRSEAHLPDVNVFVYKFYSPKNDVGNMFLFLAVQPSPRGDWKYVKEIFEMRHWWKYRAGICYKCFSTLSAGPYQHLEWFDHSLICFIQRIFIGSVVHICFFQWVTWGSRYSNVEAFDQIPRMSVADFYNRALTLSSMEKCFRLTP